MSSDDTDRLDHRYNSELLHAVRVQEVGKEYRGRLKRGGAQEYDKRLVQIESDGLHLQLHAHDIPGAIAALEALWEAIAEEELLTPSCIYCGDKLSSVKDARKHHAESHADRPGHQDGDGFDAYKYEADPNGSIQRLRNVNRRTDGTGNDRPDELPFRCEWEVGVNEAGDPEDWMHVHPLATSAEEAERKAKKKARKDRFTDPVVYMTEGPFRPDNPARVGEEMIEEVFG